MAITGTQIIERVNYLLNDVSNVQWTAAEKLSWLNDGRREMATLKPEVFGNGTEVEHSATATAKQRIATAGAYKLLTVDSNAASGKAIRPATQAQLDAFRPSWRSETGALVQNWFPDVSDPLAFWVYPVVVAGLTLKAHVYITPADLASLTDIALPFDQYMVPLVNYICFRALSKDNEGGNETKAAAYFQMFTAALKGAA